ncbi:MAG: CRTAC1 family protein [Nitrospirae bacterium]|nr:CRTAC1 family protein [Nitrospirota bacterium]
MKNINTLYYLSILLILPILIYGCLNDPKNEDSQTTFSDVTSLTVLGKAKTGLSFINPIWADFNNNNQPDILIHQHWEKLTFYDNKGNDKFKNITKNTGISPVGGKDRHGIAIGDYDNDGNLDMFITNGGCHGNCSGSKTDELWKGDGHGNFTNVTLTAGVENADGRGRSAFWVDYDNDGFLDLFVLNYASTSVLYKNNGNGTFTDVTKETGLDNIDGQTCSWADYNNDGTMDLIVVGINNDRLFKNNPSSHTFTETTSESGFLKKIGNGVSWGDYDNDGYMDLYIARGVHTNYHNLVSKPSEIHFKDEIELLAGEIKFETQSSNVTFDLLIKNTHQPNKIFLGGGKTTPSTVPFTLTRDDERLTGVPTILPVSEIGFYIWKDESDVWHVYYSSNGNLNIFYGKITGDNSLTNIKTNFKPVDTGFIDTLYKNNKDGTFSDVTTISGMDKIGSHSTALWGDYDNDGLMDLYVVDGGDISGGAPNILFKNNGDGTFTDVAGNTGTDDNKASYRHFGAAWGDYNNDGFLDLILKNGVGELYPLAYGPVILYKNNRNKINHYLKVQLAGKKSNRLGIGAKLTLTINGKNQFREVNGGGGGELRSQGSGPVHFGTGTASSIDTLTIQWPSGIVQKLTNIKADQFMTINEEE